MALVWLSWRRFPLRPGPKLNQKTGSGKVGKTERGNIASCIRIIYALWSMLYITPHLRNAVLRKSASKSAYWLRSSFSKWSIYIFNHPAKLQACIDQEAGLFSVNLLTLVLYAPCISSSSVSVSSIFAWMLGICVLDDTLIPLKALWRLVNSHVPLLVIAM